MPVEPVEPPVPGSEPVVVGADVVGGAVVPPEPPEGGEDVVAGAVVEAVGSLQFVQPAVTKNMNPGAPQEASQVPTGPEADSPDAEVVSDALITAKGFSSERVIDGQFGCVRGSVVEIHASTVPEPPTTAAESQVADAEMVPADEHAGTSQVGGSMWNAPRVYATEPPAGVAACPIPGDARSSADDSKRPSVSRSTVRGSTHNTSPLASSGSGGQAAATARSCARPE
jgi:hypothetical protein